MLHGNWLSGEWVGGPARGLAVCYNIASLLLIYTKDYTKTVSTGGIIQPYSWPYNYAI